MDYHAIAVEFFQHMMKGPKKPFQKKVDDFSHGERRILGYLTFEAQIATPGELSEKLNLTTPRVASALKSLAKKGFVVRSKDSQDKRMVLVTITDKGKTFVQEEHDKALALVEDTFRKLGEHDAKEFVRIVKRINEIYQEADES